MILAKESVRAIVTSTNLEVGDEKPVKDGPPAPLSKREEPGPEELREDECSLEEAGAELSCAWSARRQYESTHESKMIVPNGCA